jgi:hypothetical protein
MMKSRKQLIGLSLAILAYLISTFSYAQCNRFIRKSDFSALDAYEYCGSIQAAHMYSGDSAMLLFPVQKQKRYRLVVKSQEYLGEIELRLTNKEGKEVGYKSGKSSTYWEVMAETDQPIQITLKVAKKPLPTGFDTEGCVALAIGQIDNKEIVAAP